MDVAAVESAGMMAALDAEEHWRHDPLWLPSARSSAAQPISLWQWAEKTMRHLDDAGDGTFEIVPAHLSLLARAACAELREVRDAAEDDRSVPEILTSAARRFAAGLDLSDAGRDRLDRELARLLPHSPADGCWLHLTAEPGVDTLQCLYFDALERHRLEGRLAWLRDIDAVARRLADRLDADRALDPAANSPDALRSGLGTAAGGLIDVSRLAGQLPSHRGATRGPQRIGKDRRQRMEEDLATLEACLVRDRWQEDRGPGSGALILRPPAQSILDAVEVFDRGAADVADVVRALRRGRLELADEYDPAIHDRAFARLDWRSFSADELRQIPPVLVVLDAARWRANENGLGDLSTLLRSGRPIHLLITDDGAMPDSPVNVAFDPGLGYLAMAHREVFVLQTSLSTPAHLLGGLERLVMSSWPALAVVGVPPARDLDRTLDADPWLVLEARRLARDLPVYCYDPARGETWAERFDLTGNPSPDRPWPTLEGGAVFTFADLAALDPAWADHLRPATEETTEQNTDRQLPLAEFLALDDPEEWLHWQPFVVLPGSEAGDRLLVSHDLAHACADRRRAWRLLQELAGTDNEHARHAARGARAEAEREAETERQRLLAAHAEELEKVRREAAGEAMDRLVAVLLDVAAAPPNVPTASAGEAASSAPAAVAEPRADAEEAPPEAAEAAGSRQSDEAAGDQMPPANAQTVDEEPWVDSVLCTSCDDCIHINAQLFHYNGDKQVEIADPTAGSFEQLVRAAEQCPARCIHPGTPRPGDATASPEMITRAKAFQ